ncbi:hypothetical protein Sulac_1279 [Sulfobacillus acidophilus DSM 10332]|uniref:Uncharacterized protein n=1 Tax=Sulfobacillus acidophilus (strain ATCC 700253 / DSM 10332 / NAL) TaxID=679936 RepID=G8TVT2_SULAD|nr:hypothetical protein Sulac_1279 [Sulfobacillus acidophilus DSM 10332]
MEYCPGMGRGETRLMSRSTFAAFGLIGIVTVLTGAFSTMPAAVGPIPQIPRLTPVLQPGNTSLAYRLHLYYRLAYTVGMPRQEWPLALYIPQKGPIAIAGASPGGNAAPLGWITSPDSHWIVPPYHRDWSWTLGTIAMKDTPVTVNVIAPPHALYTLWVNQSGGRMIPFGTPQETPLGFITLPPLRGHIIAVMIENGKSMTAIWVALPIHNTGN